MLPTVRSVAQIKSGYDFGINLTSMKINAQGINNIKRVGGIHFGLCYDIKLATKLHFGSGLIFTSKGADYNLDSVRISMAPTYIEMPMNMVLKLSRRETWYPYVYGGPYLAYAIGGYKIGSDNMLTYLSFRKPGSDLKRIDWGFNLGAGFNYKGKIFSIHYGLGLRDQSPSQSSIMKNSVIAISIGSLMPPGKRK